MRATLITAIPLAAAIGVFGVVFGAAASAAMDPALVLGMSLLIFSGSLQFALVGLLVSGAGPVALLFTTIVLNLRHVVFGALIRPQLAGPVWRRASGSSAFQRERKRSRSIATTRGRPSTC